MPQAWHQRCDFLQVARQIWWDGCFRRQASEGFAGGERQAEEAAGGIDARRGDAARVARKKLLTPRARRTAVDWAIQEKSYSQRRACALVGMAAKTYRYAAQRADDSAIR